MKWGEVEVVFLDWFSTYVSYSCVFFLCMTSLTILMYHWNLVEYFKTLKNGQKLDLKVSQKWRFHFLNLCHIILTNAHFCPSPLTLGQLWGIFLETCNSLSLAEVINKIMRFNFGWGVLRWLGLFDQKLAFQIKSPNVCFMRIQLIKSNICLGFNLKS